MFLGSGEVEPGRPEGCGDDNPEIDLHATRPADARLRPPGGDHVGRVIPAAEVFHDRSRIGRHGDEVDVADRLATPSPTSGGLDPLHRRASPHPGEHFRHDLIGIVPELSLYGGATNEGDVLEDRGLGLFAEALHAPHAFPAAGLLE